SEFSPDDSISRAQMAAMICRVLDLTEGKSAEVQHVVPESPLFRDVGPDYWAAGDISRVVQSGVIKGRTDGTFDPEATSWRMHTAVVIARALRSVEAELVEPAS
ncbi:MAG TPA: S-layer homology domain-containing protein, partial [Thermoleophilia bacterium]|nr:S-layer homology domain-containing protein [Thermoleophilia bacterium]